MIQCLLKSCFAHCWLSDYLFTGYWDLGDCELPRGRDWCAHTHEPVVVRQQLTNVAETNEGCRPGESIHLLTELDELEVS